MYKSMRQSFSWLLSSISDYMAFDMEQNFLSAYYGKDVSSCSGWLTA